MDPSPGGLIYSMPFTAFYAVIPASIRRIPRVFYRTSLGFSDGRMEERSVVRKDYNNKKNSADDDLYRLMAASSNPQLVEGYSTGNDSMSTASTVRQRSGDSSTTDNPLDKQKSQQRASLNAADEETERISRSERASRSESVSSRTTEIPIAKYEAQSGLRWNRISPGESPAVQQFGTDRLTIIMMMDKHSTCSVQRN